MSHDESFERTQAGRQYIAGLALAHMLEVRLPAAEWTVTARGELVGHIARRGDTAAWTAIDAYSRFLRVPVLRRRGHSRQQEWVHLGVYGTYRDAPVTVWTQVAVRPVAKAVTHGA